MAMKTPLSRFYTGITIFFVCFFLFMSGPAHACSCWSCAGVPSKQEWEQTIQVLVEHVDKEFEAQRLWMINVLFEDNILPAMMLMTEQFTTVAMQQVGIFGSFFDAKHQLETQRILQNLQIEAHKDYHPSIGMCEFGSSVRSLAASERKGEINTLAFSKRALDRQLGASYSPGMFGTAGNKDSWGDKKSRIEQFKTTYCDPYDQNTALWIMCKNQPTPPGTLPPSGSPDEIKRYNKDIDYSRTIEFPWTLDVDFTDTTKTEDEEDIFALAAYLYSHNVFARPSPELLGTPSDNRVDSDLTDLQQAYLDMRAIVAKRGVAENSYQAIVGLKSSGFSGSREYMVALLNDLGLTDTAEIDALMGENPSYYAQMEILTKKIYQNPTFYTNLYDKPANVTRKMVSMQAIGLMQKFDLFESYLRSAASLSILLELAVADAQKELEDRVLGLESNTRRAD